MGKTIGIVGGMGPLAGADLFLKITRLTSAATDQEHLHILLDSNTAIPDRTAAILQGGPSPLPQLLQSCRRLEEAGAELLLLACNTAHYYYDELQPSIRGTLLHMPRETARFCRRAGYRRAALLATDGTAQSGVYARELAREGVEQLLPGPQDQAFVMSLIYGYVKAGREDMPAQPLLDALTRLERAGAEAFILGCTELPLAFERLGLLTPRTLDPTNILARRAIEEAGGALAAN